MRARLETEAAVRGRLMRIIDDAREKASNYLSFEESLRALLITSVASNFGNGLWVPLLGLYITGDLGVSALAYGLMNTVQSLVSSLTMFPSGFVSDISGRKRMIVLSYVFSILALSTLFFVRDLPLLFLVSAFYGVSLAFMEPSKSAYIIDVVPDERRGTAFATFALLQSLGTVIATSVAGVIADTFGFLWVFGIGLAFESLALVGTVLYLGESLRRGIGQTRQPRGDLSGRFRDSLAILRNPPLLAVLFGIIFHQLGLGVQNPYLAIYASQVLLFSLPSISLMLGLERLGIFIGHFPSGGIVDRYGGEVSFAFHILVTSPLMILFIYAGDPVLASSVLFLWGLTFGLDNVSRQKLIPKYRGDSGVAATFGMISLIAGVVSLASPSIGGWIWTTSSPQAVFYLSAAVNVLGSLPLFILWLYERRRRGA